MVMSDRQKEFLGIAMGEMYTTTKRMKEFVRMLKAIQSEIEGDIRAVDDLIEKFEAIYPQHLFFDDVREDHSS